jgi:ABC-2 type transport system ATP-binding protein
LDETWTRQADEATRPFGNGLAEGVEAFRVEGLTRAFGDLMAVDHLDLTVRSGEMFGFLGPNGAGKTTTIRMAAGLLRPTAGSIRIFGMDPYRRPLEVKRLIGVAPDEPPLYDRLTGRETLEFVGRIHGFSLLEARVRTRDLLDWMDLGEAASATVGEYSLGMKKKLSLACVLIHKPKLLFLDEPFSGIDPIGVKNIKGLLSFMARDGATIFFSSHVMDLVERFCTRMAIIHEGKLRALGTVKEICTGAGLGDSATLEDAFVSLVGSEARGEMASWLSE